MAQWIAIQGVSTQHTRELSARALQAFATIHRLEPSDAISSAGICAYMFPSHLAPPLKFERNPESGKWGGVAGPLFFGNLAGRKALCELVRADLQRDSGRLDGSFSIVHGDCDGELTVVTDRIGTIHVCSTNVGATAVITTSSLVLAALTDAGWDLLSCREFLATGSVFGQRTLFRGIEKIPPASIYKFQGGSLQSKSTYWKLSDFHYEQSRGVDVTERLANSLENTLKTISSNFAHPVLDLTGGLDSRATVAAAMKTGCRFSTVVGGAEGDADVGIAGLIARIYGLSHQRFEPSSDVRLEEAQAALALTDGEYDVFEYARISQIHSSLARRYDASVNGSNGEICKGYWWELLLPRTGSRSWFPDRRVASRRFAFAPDPDLLSVRFDQDLITHFTELIREANEPMVGQPNTAKMDNIYLRLRMQRWQGRIASATNRIWPAISPFMFREPMEVALTARPSKRLRNRLSRRLIEYFDVRLASLPLDNFFPALPLRLTTAPQFIRSLGHRSVRRDPSLAGSQAGTGCPKVNSEVREMISSPGLASSGLFRPGALALLAEYSTKGRITGTVLGRVATIELLAKEIRKFRLLLPDMHRSTLPS